MENLQPKPNLLYTTADSLDDAMQRVKSKLNLHTPNEIHAAVMVYHNTLLAAIIKDLENSTSIIKMVNKPNP